jgi:hypothetical protein
LPTFASLERPLKAFSSRQRPFSFPSYCPFCYSKTKSWVTT